MMSTQMDGKTLEALKASIAKWEMNVEAGGEMNIPGEMVNHFKIGFHGSTLNDDQVRRGLAAVFLLRGLYDGTAAMADGGDTTMTAAEEVLAYLLVEKIGAPDDVAYSPDQAQALIEAKLEASMKRNGDDMMQIAVHLNCEPDADNILHVIREMETDLATSKEAVNAAERERCATILESMLINTDANAVERARNRHYAKLIRDGASPSGQPV